MLTLIINVTNIRKYSFKLSLIASNGDMYITSRILASSAFHHRYYIMLVTSSSLSRYPYVSMCTVHCTCIIHFNHNIMNVQTNNNIYNKLYHAWCLFGRI